MLGRPRVVARSSPSLPGVVSPSVRLGVQNISAKPEEITRMNQILWLNLTWQNLTSRTFQGKDVWVLSSRLQKPEQLTGIYTGIYRQPFTKSGGSRSPCKMPAPAPLHILQHVTGLEQGEEGTHPKLSPTAPQRLGPQLPFQQNVWRG